MAKRILIFSTAYFPFVGGAEVAVKEITDRINDAEFDMVTARLSADLPRFEKLRNVNVYRIGFGIKSIDKCWLAFRGACFAKKLHKKNNYSAIWSIMASYAGFAAMFFKNKYKDVPYLLTLQEGDPLETIAKKTRFVAGWFKDIFLLADHIQAISNFLAAWAKNMGSVSEVDVVPNGVDVGLFTKEYSASELEELKINTGKGEHDVFLVHTGRSVLKNGLDDVIRALAFLPDNIKFLVLGTGPDHEKLKNLAESLKVARRVIFAGHQDHRAMAKYLKISDIFVRPSLSEGLGNSFLEAMAAGLPVIGTRAGGIPDFLIDRETGLFCEIRNPENLADKVKLLLQDRSLRERIVVNAKNMVIEKYDWTSVANKMRDIFNKIAAR